MAHCRKKMLPVPRMKGLTACIFLECIISQLSKWESVADRSVGN